MKKAYQYLAWFVAGQAAQIVLHLVSKNNYKKNNNVSNLEWVTQEENLAHAIRNGTNKTRISKLKMNEKYHDKFYQMTCLFPPTLFDELDALSMKTGVSKSQLIREATQEYIKHRTADKEGEG